MKINITIPVYNEEIILQKNILELLEFCQKNLTKQDWQIIIADNGSSDKTAEIGQRLAEDKQIEYLFIPQKGKGGAIRQAWQKYPADIYFFMDADLSTDLEALPKFLSLIHQGDYDLAAGSRSVKGAEVERSALRKFISYFLNLILRIVFRSPIKDHPCGFKAVSQKVIDELLPLVKNNDWFFDTELLIWAGQKNFKIKELPVKWEEPARRQSKTSLFEVIMAYLREIVRLKRESGE